MDNQPSHQTDDLPNTGTHIASTTSDYWIDRIIRDHFWLYLYQTLNVTYTTTAPTITTTGTLSVSASPVGTPSTAQTYTVAGSNLSADISIAAPTVLKYQPMAPTIIQVLP